MGILLTGILLPPAAVGKGIFEEEELREGELLGTEEMGVVVGEVGPL